MKLNKKNKQSLCLRQKQNLASFAGKEKLSKVLVWGAVLSVLFSVSGWIGRDVWLASTQWLLVATVLTLFAIYLKIS